MADDIGGKENTPAATGGRGYTVFIAYDDFLGEADAGAGEGAVGRVSSGAGS